MFRVAAVAAVVLEVVLTGVENAVGLGGEQHTDGVLRLVDVA